MAEPLPSVIVLAGPNGAGKSTCARPVLAEHLAVLTFVNADVIAQGLAGFDPQSTAFDAGRIMVERLHHLAEQRAPFAFETTLAGRSYAPWLRILRQSGYQIHLLYFWLASPDLAVARVAQRVQQGGHDIPEPTIRQRYQHSLHNFFSLYRSLAHTWHVFDNTGEGSAQLIVSGDDQGKEAILDAIVWSRIQQMQQP